MASMKILIGRLARCILLLEEHDFVVVCKSGRNHNDTDKLSRCPMPDEEQVSSALTEEVIALSLESIALAQLADPWTHPIIHHLDGREPSESTIRAQYATLSSYLCPVLSQHSPDGLRWLLLVPPERRGDVLRASHDERIAGHLGLFKKYYRVRQHLFWPGLYRTVRSYIKSCIKFQCSIWSSSAPSSLLQPLETRQRPLHAVLIFFFGPLRTSSSHSKWIIVTIDHGTRYEVTAAQSAATAE